MTSKCKRKQWRLIWFETHTIAGTLTWIHLLIRRMFLLHNWKVILVVMDIWIAITALGLIIVLRLWFITMTTRISSGILFSSNSQTSQQILSNPTKCNRVKTPQTSSSMVSLIHMRRIISISIRSSIKLVETMVVAEGCRTRRIILLIEGTTIEMLGVIVIMLLSRSMCQWLPRWRRIVTVGLRIRKRIRCPLENLASKRHSNSNKDRSWRARLCITIIARTFQEWSQCSTILLVKCKCRECNTRVSCSTREELPLRWIRCYRVMRKLQHRQHAWIWMIDRSMLD